MLPPGLQRLFYSDTQQPLCVFHDTVYARDLANATPADDRELSANLSNRIVMVGTSRAYANDFINSPLHDRIPGVYLHAMALDNLLTYGHNYKRATGFKPSNDAEHWRLLVLALFSMLWVLLSHRVRTGLKSWLHDRFAPKVVDPSPPIEIYLVGTTRYGGAHLTGDLKEDHSRRQSKASKHHHHSRHLVAGIALLVFVLEALFSVVIVAALLFVGEHCLNIGYFSVVSVATFSLAAEWLEWNQKLIGWLFRDYANQTTHTH